MIQNYEFDDVIVKAYIRKCEAYALLNDIDNAQIALDTAVSIVNKMQTTSSITTDEYTSVMSAVERENSRLTALQKVYYSKQKKQYSKLFA